MNAKMTNQIITADEYGMCFLTTYVTNIDILEFRAERAKKLINEFCTRHFKNNDIPIFDTKYEKNGIIGFWQFTVQTYREITEYNIIEETSEQVKERLLHIAQEWYEQEGYANYPAEMTITKVEEVEGGIRVTLFGDCGGDVVTLQRGN